MYLLMQNSIPIGIGIVASPIIFALAVFPDSFNMGWNQGRGEFLIALVFVIAELFIAIKLVISTKKLVTVTSLAVITMAYFIGLEYGLRDYIVGSAEQYNIHLVDSWVWMWDFVVMFIFM